MGVSTGVSVVPSTGMKGVAFKVADAFYGWQFGSVQRTVGVHDKARFEGVLSVGGYNPAALRLIPVCGGDQCLQKRAIVQRVFLGNHVAVL